MQHCEKLKGDFKKDNNKAQTEGKPQSADVVAAFNAIVL